MGSKGEWGIGNEARDRCRAWRWGCGRVWLPDGWSRRCSQQGRLMWQSLRLEVSRSRIGRTLRSLRKCGYVLSGREGRHVGRDEPKVWDALSSLARYRLYIVRRFWVGWGPNHWRLRRSWLIAEVLSDTRLARVPPRALTPRQWCPGWPSTECEKCQALDNGIKHNTFIVKKRCSNCVLHRS